MQFVKLVVHKLEDCSYFDCLILVPCPGCDLKKREEVSVIPSSCLWDV